jgi:hypothetical protein
MRLLRSNHFANRSEDFGANIARTDSSSDVSFGSISDFEPRPSQVR